MSKYGSHINLQLTFLHNSDVHEHPSAILNNFNPPNVCSCHKFWLNKYAELFCWPCYIKFLYNNIIKVWSSGRVQELLTQWIKIVCSSSVEVIYFSHCNNNIVSHWCCIFKNCTEATRIKNKVSNSIESIKGNLD